MEATPRPGASELIRSVGSRVRELRRESHLTLDELSERSGVSRRMITMLESGEANVSLGTLDKLARALGCDFYAMITGGSVAPLTPEESRQVEPLWEDGRGSTARLLISRPRAASTELWQWELAPSSRYEGEADPPGSEEIILVSDGRLVVEVDGEEFPLDAGGYLRLPTDRPYGYSNPGDSAVRFVRFLLMP